MAAVNIAAVTKPLPYLSMAAIDTTVVISQKIVAIGLR